jgi:hypothetical protein
LADAADDRPSFGERSWVSLPLNPSYGADIVSVRGVALRPVIA